MQGKKTKLVHSLKKILVIFNIFASSFIWGFVFFGMSYLAVHTLFFRYLMVMEQKQRWLISTKLIKDRYCVNSPGDLVCVCVCSSTFYNYMMWIVEIFVEVCHTFPITDNRTCPESFRMGMASSSVKCFLFDFTSLISEIVWLI